MRNIIVLGPGKSGTTYLGSRITNSLVVHDIGRSRFKFIVFIKQLLFFSQLILFKHLVILPYINDSKRRRSVFWNDFEIALMHFKKTGCNYKVIRYKSTQEFLQACFDHYPYESYHKWFKRNKLDILMELPEARNARSKFFKSHIIMCPLENIDVLLSELKDTVSVSSNKPKFNRKEDFWHRTLHEFVKGEEIESK
jgi:hypothetical protein